MGKSNSIVIVSGIGEEYNYLVFPAFRSNHKSNIYSRFLTEGKEAADHPGVT